MFVNRGFPWERVLFNELFIDVGKMGQALGCLSAKYILGQNKDGNGDRLAPLLPQEKRHPSGR